MEPSYSVTVQHPHGYAVTIRHVSEKKLLDGLVTFGGIRFFGTSRQTIIDFKEETQNPTADEITCNGKFGCE